MCDETNDGIYSRDCTNNPRSVFPGNLWWPVLNANVRYGSIRAVDLLPRHWGGNDTNQWLTYYSEPGVYSTCFMLLHPTSICYYRFVISCPYTVSPIAFFRITAASTQLAIRSLRLGKYPFGDRSSWVVRTPFLSIVMRWSSRFGFMPSQPLHSSCYPTSTSSG